MVEKVQATLQVLADFMESMMPLMMASLVQEVMRRRRERRRGRDL